MRKIYLYMTMSLDGFIAGPNNELDWMTRRVDQELNDDVIALMSSADTGVIGYPTAVGMVPYWANVEKDATASQADRELAQVINRTHSVILSNTEAKLDFGNSELLVVKNDQDFFEAITQL